MGILRRHWNKVLVRYLLSYLLVLMAPVLTFSVLQERYFVILYRDGILNQNILALDNISTQMGMHLSEMDAISIQISNNSWMSRVNLRADGPRYTKVRSALKGILGAKSFFSHIALYSQYVPDVVFTAEGTFNPVYYQQYLWGDRYVRLPDYLSEERIIPWVFSDDLRNNVSGSLTRVIPIPAHEGSYLLLTIDDDRIRQLAQTPDGQTIVLDGNGSQLYPFDRLDDSLLMELTQADTGKPYTRISQNRYALYSRGSEGNILCIRVISEDVILQPVHDLQRLYMAILLAIILAGGVVIYLMAFLSYRPIRELSEYAQSRMPGIPDELSGVKKASFAIRKLDEGMTALRQKSLRDKLILSMLYGRLQDQDALERECREAGLACDDGQYRVAILLFPGNAAVSQMELDNMLRECMGEGVRCNITEYPDHKRHIIFLGYPPEEAAAVKEKLRVLGRRLENDAVIAVGNGCGTLGGIGDSYYQAGQVSKLDPALTGANVLFHDEIAGQAERFVYPKLELEALYVALTNADTERIYLMTEILADMVRENDVSQFTKVSLCFDIIKSFSSAYEEINSGQTGLLPADHAGKELDPSNIDGMLGLIEDLCAQTVRELQKDLPAAMTKDDRAPSKILAYIDEHWNDSELCVSSVADHFAISISNLSHRFKAQTGHNISAYISEKKMVYAKELLVTTGMTLAEVSELVGYKQTSSFIRKFKKFEGMTPSEYREAFASRSGSEKK